MVYNRTEHKDSYEKGRVNLSISLSVEAHEMLQDNEIGNFSAFINDLVIDALIEKEYWKKKQMALINSARKELKDKYGIDSELVIK